jgi:hypothetical protein
MDLYFPDQQPNFSVTWSNTGLHILHLFDMSFCPLLKFGSKTLGHIPKHLLFGRCRTRGGPQVGSSTFIVWLKCTPWQISVWWFVNPPRIPTLNWKTNRTVITLIVYFPKYIFRFVSSINVSSINYIWREIFSNLKVFCRGVHVLVSLPFYSHIIQC